MAMKRHGSGTNRSPHKASRRYLLTHTFTTWVIICCAVSFLEAEINTVPKLMANVTPGSQKMREQSAFGKVSRSPTAVRN